jgi:hypothetical protein
MRAYANCHHARTHDRTTTTAPARRGSYAARSAIDRRNGGRTHHACVVRGQQQPAEIIRGTHRAHMVGGGLSIMIPRFFLPSDNQNIQGMASLPVANLSYCPCRWTDRGIHGTSLASQLGIHQSIDVISFLDLQILILFFLRRPLLARSIGQI